MIPRIDTIFVDEAAKIDGSFAKQMDTGHSRFPVYRETIDNVVGILYVKDLLKSLIGGEAVSIPDVLRPAYFVPESMKIDSLLREMKQRRCSYRRCRRRIRRSLRNYFHGRYS